MTATASPTDPVDLAQRLATILEGGRRVATYKLAALLALLDACAEAERNPGPNEPFALSILDLADRVIDLYWPQVRTYNDTGPLLQSTGPKAKILEEVRQLRLLAPRAATIRLAHAHAYERARRRVALTLAQQPLPKLQTPGGHTLTRVCFLYDDSWLGEDVTLRDLDARAWTLELLPGVADSLVRLGGLLRPVIEHAWTDDVARLNRIDRQHADLSRFLFGAERSSLAKAATVLREIEGDDCFYCRGRIRGVPSVDHFVPWAKVPFNGLSNMVLSDPICNGAKSDTLASLEHLGRWEHRDQAALAEAGAVIAWPAEWERSQRIARGLYSRLPAGTPLWRAKGVYDLSP